MRYQTDGQYSDRATKARYIALKYASILEGSVLDVGCDAAPLRRLVKSPDRYVGVDLDIPKPGEPGADVAVNLDREPLPMPDRSFDTVVCTDVLEHLERCHAVFDSLCRIARRHVIASLPNPLLVLASALYEGSGGRIKYYGLPVDPPADRHRWFFGADDSRRFFTERGSRCGFDVEQMDAEGEAGRPGVERPYWKNAAGRDVLDHPNLKGGTLWCVLTRRSGGAE